MKQLCYLNFSAVIKITAPFQHSTKNNFGTLNQVVYQWVLAVCTFLLNRSNYNTIVQDFFSIPFNIYNHWTICFFFSIFILILLVYSLTVCLLIICLNSLTQCIIQKKKIIKNVLLQIAEYGLMNNYLFRFPFFVGHRLILIWTLWSHCWNHRKVTE